MKRSELKNLIKEEIQKILKEDNLSTRLPNLTGALARRAEANPHDTLALVKKYLDTKYPGIKYTMEKPGGLLVNLQIKVKPHTAMLQMAGDAKWEGWVQTNGAVEPGDHIILTKMVSKDPKESFKKIKPWIDTVIKNMQSKSY